MSSDLLRILRIKYIALRARASLGHTCGAQYAQSEASFNERTPTMTDPDDDDLDPVARMNAEDERLGA